MPARTTSYELILEPLERTAFPAIRDEARQRGTDTRRRDQFLLLGHVGATLKEIVPDDAPVEALDEYGELLYQGFQFWNFGRRFYSLTDAATAIVTAPEYEMPDWSLTGPPACYLQVPNMRLWARVAAEAPFEPVDGCFVVLDETEPGPDRGAHLRAQLILGVRTDRPGISLVSYRTDLDPSAAAEHARAPWRNEGTAFANAIPGGERMGYRTLATTSELEALVIRTLHYIDQRPRALRPEDGTSQEGESHLPHTLVT